MVVGLHCSDFRQEILASSCLSQYLSVVLSEFLKKIREGASQGSGKELIVELH